LKLWAQALLLMFLAVFGCATAAGNNDFGSCPDQDVWVYIKHSDPWHRPCIVIVHIPKHSLLADFENAPSKDVKVMGEGRAGFGLTQFTGFHVVVLKKGFLNDPGNYTTRPPKKVKIEADNIKTWYVNR